MSFVPYQGGIPTLYTRRSPYQRGAGFFSSLKRYLLPLAKTALPHVASAVGDVIGGKKTAVEALKSHGKALGSDVLSKAADFVGGVDESEEPVKKGIKRKASSKKQSVVNRKRQRWN